MKKKLIFALFLLLLTALSLCACSEHVHTAKDSWQAGVAATCTTEGTIVKRCSGCYAVMETQSTPKLGHYTEDWITVSEATCTAEGQKRLTCLTCNEMLEQQNLPMKDHTPSDWIVDRTGTCMVNGSRHIECTTCSSTLQTEATTGSHMVTTKNAISPTCTEVGYTQEVTCSLCAEVLDAREELAATGHKWLKVAATQPTCAKVGNTEGSKCETCGEWNVRTEQIDKLAHTPVDDAAVAPTCTKTGLTAGKHCSVCKETIVKQNTVSATGHDFSVFTNRCEVCQDQQLDEIRSHDEWLAYDESHDAVVYLPQVIGSGESGTYYATLVKSVNHFRVVGDVNQIYKLYLVIEERDNPITIDFVNASVSARNSIISCESDVDVTVNLYGEQCMLLCEKAATGAAKKDGANGNAAISVKGDLTVNMNADYCHIQGGEGGDGGDAPDTWGSNAADGGNGGDGAYAISAATITVKLGTDLSKEDLYLVGGKGGKGGAGGDAKGMFGQSNSLLYEDGDPGENGSASYATNVTVNYR